MIDIKEINLAQKDWGDGIVKIGLLKSTFKESRIFTLNFINEMYDFEKGSVQFKPTKASDFQFRNDLKGALSYFIGSDNNYIEDKGFALNPWTKVEFENNSINIYENIALVMGNYYFTDLDGDKTKVEYTFSYKKNNDSNIKIILHHSSLPYNK